MEQTTSNTQNCSSTDLPWTLIAKFSCHSWRAPSLPSILRMRFHVPDSQPDFNMMHKFTYDLNGCYLSNEATLDGNQKYCIRSKLKAANGRQSCKSVLLIIIRQSCKSVLLIIIYVRNVRGSQKYARLADYFHL